MSLPVGEQRILEAMEDDLRASEPRLASMYAIFARLTGNDGRPLREQLPAVRRRWKARSRTLKRGPVGWLRRRRPVTRVLILSHLVAVLAVFGLLIGLNSPAARASCPATPHRRALIWRPSGARCPVQNDHSALSTLPK